MYTQHVKPHNKNAATFGLYYHLISWHTTSLKKITRRLKMNSMKELPPPSFFCFLQKKRGLLKINLYVISIITTTYNINANNHNKQTNNILNTNQIKHDTYFIFIIIMQYLHQREMGCFCRTTTVRTFNYGSQQNR